MRQFCSVATFLALLFYTTSCGKSNLSYWPLVTVDFYVNMSDAKYNSILAENNVIMIDGQGIAGVVVYHGSDGYKAYDRCSSVNVEQKNALTWSADNPFELIDSKSGAKFSLLNGAPANSKASRALLSYNVYQLGSGFSLRITN